MTWPTVAVVTTNLDAATDSPASARADLLDAVTKQNQMIAHVSNFGSQLLDDADAPAARGTLGTDVYKTLPSNTTPVSGEMMVVTGSFTINTGYAAGTAFMIYNNSASMVTITQGAGLTLRFAGTSSFGNRSFLGRGLVSVWCLSTTEYILSGAGVY